MADPKQLLRILEYRDIDVRVEGERLIARSRHGQLPDDMRRLIQRFRGILIPAVLEEERIAETVANILSLTPEEIEQYRREVEAAPNDQPEIDHDREAWLRACFQMKVAEAEESAA